jgi:hypothetical protein
MEEIRRFRRREKPSVKQIYALAAALCERAGEEFPESKLEASDLIQRLRDENGDPRARLRGPAVAAPKGGHMPEYDSGS